MNRCLMKYFSLVCFIAVTHINTPFQLDFFFFPRDLCTVALSKTLLQGWFVNTHNISEQLDIELLSQGHLCGGD